MPANVNFPTAEAKDLHFEGKSSGTVIPVHFLTESANTPNGAAAVDKAFGYSRCKNA